MSDYGEIVLQKRADGGVTVIEAPAESRLALEVLRYADDDRMRISGDHLLLPPDQNGIAVVYRIEGWDDITKSLIIRQIPREDPS